MGTKKRKEKKLPSSKRNTKIQWKIMDGWMDNHLLQNKFHFVLYPFFSLGVCMCVCESYKTILQTILGHTHFPTSTSVVPICLPFFLVFFFNLFLIFTLLLVFWLLSVWLCMCVCFGKRCERAASHTISTYNGLNAIISVCRICFVGQNDNEST